MFLHKQIDFPRANGSVRDGLHRTRRPDSRARLSHQMSEATADASGRFVVRAVPLLYAALLGGLADSMLFSLSIGMIATIYLDLQMQKQSMLRPWLQPLWSVFLSKRAGRYPGAAKKQPQNKDLAARQGQAEAVSPFSGSQQFRAR